MATFTTVAELKKHLNIEADWTEDDSYLQELLYVAEMAISNYCNGGLEEDTTVVVTNGSYTALPKTIKQACLFLAAHYYLNRTPIAFTSTSELPYTFQFLLNPYKNFVIQ